METGTVKWFDNKKGFGFIQGDDSTEYFVHYTSIIMEGYRTLTEGQKVVFEIEETAKGQQATNIILEVE